MLLCGDQQDVRKVVFCRPVLNERQKFCAFHQIDLVQDQQYRGIYVAQKAQRKRVLLGGKGFAVVFVMGFAICLVMDAVRRIDQEQHGIARVQGIVHFLHHALVELRARLVYAGCIDQHDLGGGLGGT